ncbi:MAG: Asp23/Gls24 family envelope stress response protein [Chloroflexi bacterium]|nr:Asp23/Gls24 family envelope stress response protein [Chloroflexota bacterium]
MTDSQTDLGKIQISPQAIATLTVQTVLEVYGVVGLAGKTKFDDWRHGWFHSKNAHHGVEVSMEEEGVVVDLYLIIEYGTRISEVARSVMRRVRYVLEQQVGLPVIAVNVHVQGLRVSAAEQR